MDRSAAWVGLLLVGLAAVGLLVLLRGLDREPADEPPEVDRYLRRTDLLEAGRRPRNPLEWIITFPERPRAQVVVLVAVISVTAGAALTGAVTIAAIGSFYVMLAGLSLFLFHGWDHLEGRLGVEPFEATETSAAARRRSLPAPVRHRLTRTRSTSTATDDGRPLITGTADLKITLLLVVGLLVMLSVVAYAATVVT
ncbi:MAG: hypothetical protein ACOC0X_07325 [Halobacteriota archaeon]